MVKLTLLLWNKPYHKQDDPPPNHFFYQINIQNSTLILTECTNIFTIKSFNLYFLFYDFLRVYLFTLQLLEISDTKVLGSYIFHHWLFFTGFELEFSIM